MAQDSKTPTADKIIIDAFAKLDRTALGLAVGAVFGLAVFAATMILIVRSGDVVGPNLALLGQFFFGYKVTFAGAFIGLAYGFVTGFVIGWLMALLRNAFVSAYLVALRTRATLSSSLDSID